MYREVGVAGLDHVGDHADQAHTLSVFRTKNARHTIVMQLFNLGRHDHTTAAAEDFDVRTAA